MKKVQVTGIDVLTGLKQDILLPVKDSPPPHMNMLADFSAIALATLLAREDVEEVRVARFDLPGDNKQFLVATDQDPEVYERFESSGRQLRHGDVYEADVSGVTRHEDVEEQVLTKSEVSRQTQEGIEEPVVREDLEREEIAGYTEHIERLAAEQM